MSTYTHRNGESEEPTVGGWYWFDGVEVWSGDSVAKRPIFVEREDGELGSIYWYGANDDADDACADGWLRGQWWGPLEAPWQE